MKLQSLHERQRELLDECQKSSSLHAELSRVNTQIQKMTNDRRIKLEPPTLLQRVKVASPCKQSWEDMTGDEKKRHCQRCEKTVYNLSEMTKVEAETLLKNNGSSLCVQFYRRQDGTVMTKDCNDLAKSQKRNRLFGAFALAAATMAGMTANTTWLGTDGKKHLPVLSPPIVEQTIPHDLEVTMGELPPIIEELLPVEEIKPPPRHHAIRGKVAYKTMDDISFAPEK